MSEPTQSRSARIEAGMALLRSGEESLALKILSAVAAEDTPPPPPVKLTVYPEVPAAQIARRRVTLGASSAAKCDQRISAALAKLGSLRTGT